MDFVILKVNGKDVSQASHEDVAQAFLQAVEPISIQVLRRKRSTNPSSVSEVAKPVIKDSVGASHPAPGEADKSLAVQTTSSRSCICPRCGYNIDAGAAVVETGVTTNPQSASAIGSLDLQPKEDLEDDDDGLADEVEFKVTIRKSSGQTNLDVMCRNINTEGSRYQAGFVIVDQIRDEQIIKDGLLCEGDRILQINNQSISDADHAMRMFADPSVRQYIILITRPIDDEQDDGDSVEELRMSLSDELHENADGSVDTDILDGSLTIHEKDSGLAESCKNDDSSENDLMSPRSSKYNTTSSGGCCDDGDNIMEINVKETGIQTDANLSFPQRQFQSQISLTNIENELLAITKRIEMAQINAGKSPKNTAEAKDPPTPPPKPPRLPRTTSLSPQNVDTAKALVPRRKKRSRKPSEEEKNQTYIPVRPGVTRLTSPEFCAFSLSSSIPKQENSMLTSGLRGKTHDNNDLNTVFGANNLGSGKLSSFTPKTQAAPVLAPAQQVPVGRNSFSWLNHSQLRTVREDEELCPQKQHIYEQILPSANCPSLQRSSGVKSSASRRPVRNKLLHERAQRINKERCGVTTDDDAKSELKLGRYWPKDDRRRHLESADTKRRRENEVFRFQLAVPMKPKIVLLSEQKQLRKFAKKGDGFDHNVGTSEPVGNKSWHNTARAANANNGVCHLTNHVTTV
ncbi:PDZ domain-containing RING finger protein 4-like [Paramacrobiotus metropolitanus]|uniref:PDZ domain-containing RING finger protein 4-like n=1 Tax=Paramacrobiotus metropolitanus TaxID=2943436 RepID=UPI002445CF07|nr:PDZ domain-containing RING finger protein 4-like [Paramacrobiotus metropolitanus]